MAEDSTGSGRPLVRASDGDRQRVVDLLREHTSAGRLTIEEYEERVDAAYAARTVAALRPLVADLPVRIDDVLPPDVPAVVSPAGQEWRPARPEWVRGALLGTAAVILLVLVVASRGRLIFLPLLLGGWFFVFGGRRDSGRRQR